MSNGVVRYPSFGGGGNEYEDIVSGQRFIPASVVSCNRRTDANSEYERRSFLQPATEPPEENLKKLESCNKKLKKWNKRMMGTLAVMLFVLVATGIIVAVKMGPQFQKVFRHWMGQHDSSDTVHTVAAQPRTCDNCLSEEKGQVDRLSSCADGTTLGNCASEINTLYSSQHTRLKEDEEADDELDKNVRSVLKKLESEADDRVIYRWRPIAHLYLNREESLKASPGPLVWKGRVEDPPIRRMEVDESKQIRISEKGYYYVYSHVVFNNSDHLSFSIIKNVGNDQRKLLETNDITGTEEKSANLEGIFSLKTNDTLSVFSYAKYIREGAGHKMYFGAFLL